MKSKPGWRLWLAWLVAYTILDMLFDVLLLHGSVTVSNIAASMAGAIFAATLTWLFAYRKWLNSDSMF